MSDGIHCPVVIVGGGGTGLSAALAASDSGAQVLVIERDATPLGTTAMSTGLIPAAGTPEQAALGIIDSPTLLAQDIVEKTKGRTDAAMALRMAEESADTFCWLRDVHQVPLAPIDGFLYPGHSVMRMVGTPNRTGSELMAGLEVAAERAGVMVLTEAVVVDLDVDGDRVVAVVVERPDGARERIECDSVILACSGFGGNASLVARHIPEMADAVFHGHPGNRGDAIRWGEAMGAAVADMSAYQGHGGLAAGHGVPILWPLIMEGGFQVNCEAMRFSNEATGYSEQAARVNAQPGQVAWSIFDERLHVLMLAFDDYRDALKAGAVVHAETVAELAQRAKLPVDALANCVANVEAMTLGDAIDTFGRDFTGKPPLAGPWHAAKVTGALFHTQGGLVVDGDARVLRPNGTPLPNLFAGGGAARGISGDGADGYMAGNGLLTATTMGKLAGRAAARQVACENQTGAGGGAVRSA